jgi:hypothetical protein
MEDLMEKKLDKNLKNSDVERRLEALQKSIEQLAKNSKASRKEKKKGKQPASAKK